MKRTLLLLFLSLLTTMVLADDTTPKSTAPNADPLVDFQFDGAWKPKGAILKGVFLPPPSLEAISLMIRGDTYEVTVEGEEHSDKGIYILDETTTPKRMVIKSLSGPNEGKIILAIYEVKAHNAMRVCYDLSGAAFPKEFKAPKNTELYVVGYRRQSITTADDN